MFCRRRLLVETAMDLSNRGVKSDSGFNIALYGMRAFIEEVYVLNEEEAENNKNERSEENGDEQSMRLMVQLLLWMKQFFPHLFQTRKGERRRESQQIKKLQRGI